MKKHFIFDCDDTLTNSYDFNQQMFVDTFLPYDPKIDQNYLRELHFNSRGTAMNLQFETAINHFKLNADPQEMMEENEQIHIKNIGNMTMFEDVHNLFTELKKKGRTISITSNRQYGSLKLVIERNNLTQYVDNLITCKDEGFEKPDPTCLINLIDKYNAPKEEFLYFGDSKTDSDFALNAGIDYIIVDHYLNQKKFYKIILQMFLK
jgi:phosphoglycolate phosphatase-like HAD superfamily hydrolase